MFADLFKGDETEGKDGDGEGAPAEGDDDDDEDECEDTEPASDVWISDEDLLELFYSLETFETDDSDESLHDFHGFYKGVFTIVPRGRTDRKLKGLSFLEPLSVVL